jgi:hypothetical protein
MRQMHYVPILCDWLPFCSLKWRQIGIGNRHVVVNNVAQSESIFAVFAV